MICVLILPHWWQQWSLVVGLSLWDYRSVSCYEVNRRICAILRPKVCKSRLLKLIWIESALCVVVKLAFTLDKPLSHLHASVLVFLERWVPLPSLAFKLLRRVKNDRFYLCMTIIIILGFDLLIVFLDWFKTFGWTFALQCFMLYKTTGKLCWESHRFEFSVKVSGRDYLWL